MREATIGALVDGDRALVRGTVEAAGPLVEGPDGEGCVYWDRRARLTDEAAEHGGERFWVVDGEHRVLVAADHLEEVRARGDWREEVIAIATSEIAAVSQELAELKEKLKRHDDPQLRRRRKHLAKVATLLCSLKAHARGKVHGKGTLESQARWIEKNRHLADDGPGKATMERAVQRLVMVLRPGDEVTVSARFQVEPLPAGLGAGGGYRDRPTCLVARGATVIGRGAASAAATAETFAQEQAAERAEARTAGAAFDARLRRKTDRTILTVVSLVTGVAAIAWLLARL